MAFWFLRKMLRTFFPTPFLLSKSFGDRASSDRQKRREMKERINCIARVVMGCIFELFLLLL